MGTNQAMPRRQGDGSESKLLAATPEDLSSNPWHTGKKQGMIVCVPVVPVLVGDRRFPDQPI